MPLRHLYPIIAVAFVVASCKAGDKAPLDSPGVVADTGGAVEPPPPPPAPYDVTISMECIGADSVSFGMKPWVWTLPKNGKVDWGLVSNSITDVKLEPIDNTGPWPFTEPGEVIVRRGQATRRSRGQQNAQPRIRYAITGTCTRQPSGRVDTIVIDPIMILPN